MLKRNRRFRWFSLEGSDGQGARSPGNAQQLLIERDAVERALGALNEDYRAPLLLFGHYGFRVAEIAQILGISEGAVKTRVYRAKEMFIRAYRQGDKE
jgi:RNA polymerase sigma-70 factor (ECF subfamily)